MKTTAELDCHNKRVKQQSTVDTFCFVLVSGGNFPSHSSIRTTPCIGAAEINDLLAVLHRGAASDYDKWH